MSKPTPTPTPGPWSAEFEESIHVRGPDGGRVAICTNLKGRHGMGGRRDANEVEANARLIAAAPDLLEACEAAARIFDGGPIAVSREYAGELTLIREAIASATGN